MNGEPTEWPRWELAAESIVVKIRWFGVVMGYILVQTRTGLSDPWAVRAFLALGAGYAALDLAFWRMGEVIFKRLPLFVSMMESVFIALLCYHDTGIDSPFRWYYLLSLICCSLRYRPAVALWTFGFHSLSLLLLSLTLGQTDQIATSLPLTLTLMAWVTWASASLSSLYKMAVDRLEGLNAELRSIREELELRVKERTGALQASQARVVQQEKMAAFGLLAAGIAHEVGNPLAGLSSIVQILQRRRPDPYTSEKLDLAARQLLRIERTIRELVDFSRPASTNLVRVRVQEVVDEALGIAKYYQRTRTRTITRTIAPDTPTIPAIRDYLAQVILNLVLNAIDATDEQGRIHLNAFAESNALFIVVEDDGRGIPIRDHHRIFEPFFTSRPQGTGLGLFVCRQMLEEFGGTLTVRSEPGAGAAFTIRLPLGCSERSCVSTIPPCDRLDSEDDSAVEWNAPPRVRPPSEVVEVTPR